MSSASLLRMHTRAPAPPAAGENDEKEGHTQAANPFRTPVAPKAPIAPLDSGRLSIADQRIMRGVFKDSVEQHRKALGEYQKALEAHRIAVGKHASSVAKATKSLVRNVASLSRAGEDGFGQSKSVQDKTDQMFPLGGGRTSRRRGPNMVQKRVRPSRRSQCAANQHAKKRTKKRRTYKKRSLGRTRRA